MKLAAVALVTLAAPSAAMADDFMTRMEMMRQSAALERLAQSQEREERAREQERRAREQEESSRVVDAYLSRPTSTVVQVPVRVEVPADVDAVAARPRRWEVVATDDQGTSWGIDLNSLRAIGSARVVEVTRAGGRSVTQLVVDCRSREVGMFAPSDQKTGEGESVKPKRNSILWDVVARLCPVATKKQLASR